MCSPALEKALESALTRMKTRCSVGPLAEVAATTVRLLEEDAVLTAAQQRAFMLEETYRAPDRILINKRVVGLIGGDFLKGVCQYLGVDCMVEYGVQLVDYNPPKCKETAN
jgi:hypothetical protein